MPLWAPPADRENVSTSEQTRQIAATNSTPNRLKWQSSRSLAPLISPPFPRMGPRHGALNFQIVYQFMLRSVFSNSQIQLVQIFNGIFYPLGSLMPVGLTVEEWHHIWSHRTLLRSDSEPGVLLGALDDRH